MYWFLEKERETLICCSTYSCTHWWILILVSTRNHNCNPWHIRTMLWPTEAPGQGFTLLLKGCVTFDEYLKLCLASFASVNWNYIKKTTFFRCDEDSVVNTYSMLKICLEHKSLVKCFRTSRLQWDSNVLYNIWLIEGYQPSPLKIQSLSFTTLRSQKLGKYFATRCA